MKTGSQRASSIANMSQTRQQTQSERLTRRPTPRQTLTRNRPQRNSQTSPQPKIRRRSLLRTPSRVWDSRIHLLNLLVVDFDSPVVKTDQAGGGSSRNGPAVLDDRSAENRYRVSPSRSIAAPTGIQTPTTAATEYVSNPPGRTRRAGAGNSPSTISHGLVASSHCGNAQLSADRTSPRGQLSWHPFCTTCHQSVGGGSGCRLSPQLRWGSPTAVPNLKRSPSPTLSYRVFLHPLITLVLTRTYLSVTKIYCACSRNSVHDGV